MSMACEKLIAGAHESHSWVDNIKMEDNRPQRLGWAPGGYVCRCSRCGSDFAGDKRAYQCADCAYGSE